MRRSAPTLVEAAALYEGADVGRIVDELLAVAERHSSRGIGDLVGKAQSLKRKGGLTALAAFSGELGAKDARGRLARHVAQAGVHAAALGVGGGPVYVSEVTSTVAGLFFTTLTHTVYVGTSAADAVRFGPGKARIARSRQVRCPRTEKACAHRVRVGGTLPPWQRRFAGAVRSEPDTRGGPQPERLTTPGARLSVDPT